MNVISFLGYLSESVLFFSERVHQWKDFSSLYQDDISYKTYITLWKSDFPNGSTESILQAEMLLTWCDSDTTNTRGLLQIKLS
jgi:hypothetical protein